MLKRLSFLRSSPYAKTVYRYCHIFLAVDLVLICLIVYGWYIACDYNFCTILPRKSKTSILTFGDSMTRGFVKRTLYYPYSKSLEKTLNRLHSAEVFFVVDEAGVNGDTAVGTSTDRLRSSLRKKKYEWVIILLGTNDLWRVSVKPPSSLVDKVFATLKEQCEIALQEHRMVILGTITARQCEGDAFYSPVCDAFAQNRLLLNKKIRSYVASSSAMLLLADFDKDLNYKAMNDKKRKEYWSDNVHLTETGYEVMAKLVYRKMQPYLPAMVRQPNAARNITLKELRTR